MRKYVALTRAFLVTYLFSVIIKVRLIDASEKPMRFLTYDLNKKLKTSESTFRRSLCAMVVCKVLKSKVEIDLAFFLTLTLFSLVKTGIEFCTTQNFF